jgi:hypothetical protein
MGKMWMDHYGDLVINNKKTGEKAVLRVRKKND